MTEPILSRSDLFARACLGIVFVAAYSYLGAILFFAAFALLIAALASRSLLLILSSSGIALALVSVGFELTSGDSILLAVTVVACLGWAGRGSLTAVDLGLAPGCPRPTRPLRFARGAVNLGIVLNVVLIAFRPFSPWHIAGWSIILLCFLWHLSRQNPTPSRRHRYSANVVLATFSTLMSLLLVELGARFIVKPLPLSDDVWMHHSEYVSALRPGAEGIQINGDTDAIIPLAISNEGFRDREFGAKEEGEFRILMLGDSFTFGFGERVEHSIPKYLEQALADQFPERKITVINGGVSGHGPWQSHWVFRERGAKLNPDLVVLQVLPANDLHDTLAKEGRYLRAFEYASTSTWVYWRLGPDWRVSFELWAFRNLYAYRGLSKGLYNTGWFIRLFNHLRFMEPLAEDGELRIPKPLDRPRRFEAALKESYPDLEDAWQMFGDDIVALKQDCEERGIDFVAFCIPVIRLMSDARWEMLSNGPRSGLYERGKEVRRVHDVFESGMVEYVDVPAALDALPNLQDLRHEYDAHLSATGNEQVAGLLADYLLGRGLQVQNSARAEVD